ncbi:MAG: DNA-protecting protein DprA [Bacteroidales bacterium]|nr:DNA-protecting protein DprA [Bacteroidales bacterium]
MSMLLYQIGLTLLPGVGDVLGKKLVAYCGGVDAVFKQKREALEKIPGIGEKLVSSILSQNVLQRAEEEIAFIEKHNITPLFYLDKNYPDLLKHCADSPVMLYYKGNASLNVTKIISIVGTRKATDYGKEVCEKLIRGLAEYNVLVLSGLAYGIDTCAHRSALENKLNTVAVLGHGLDRIYPFMNRGLATKMLEHGGLLTEFMSKTLPDRENFPQRNRIIAGMADATVVVEAAKSGGALITAAIANSYSRDVFAIPGRIGDTWSEGCNLLIRDNKAALIQDASDLAMLMGWENNKDKKQGRQPALFTELSPDEEKIVGIMRVNGNMGIDEITIKSDLPTSKVASVLLNLEFQGVVRALPGKIYKLDI